jgi:nicotinate-nucleotide adenylyltransferase
LAALGLFGGTFDPIHFGHLRLATELSEAFHLDQVLFIPNGLPYHRGRSAHASEEERVTMLKLATSRDARFGVDERELRRQGPTYTYDTLVELRRERGPTIPIVFLLGIRRLSRASTRGIAGPELFDLAHFAVAIRGGRRELVRERPWRISPRMSGRDHPQPARAGRAPPPAA